MFTIKSLLKKTYWYIIRPPYYRTFIHKINDKFDKRNRKTTTSWCEAQALSTDDALEHITGKPFHPSFSTEYAPLLKEAQERVDACPARMGGGGDLELLYQLCEQIRARTVLETGVAYGWSSLAILCSLAKRGGTLLSTDLPYPTLHAEDYVGCAIPDSLKIHWILKRGSDRSLLKKLISSGPFDLCHYDSDKSYRGRMWTYPLLWKALKPGGIFLSDDIGDNSAFKNFCEAHNLNPVVIGFKQSTNTKYIGYLKKPL
jgi:predicted O-methyltransferase YrrM